MSVSSSSAPILLVEPQLNDREAVTTAWLGPLIALATAGMVTLFAFRQTMASMVTIWNGSSTYSYGFVIVPLCALLVWRRRDDLRTLHPTTSLLGLTLFFFSAGLWVAGNVADVQVIQHIALITMLDALVWTFLGNASVRVLRFALLFLFFAVPVGDSLVPLLQQWTAAFTVNALRLSGIPAVQDGLILSTPSGNWQVAEACSGIRYLIASIVIGVLVAGVAYRSWKRRITFQLLSALLPIIANAVRAYGIVVLAYLSGNAIATGVDHVIYGFVFFSLLTAILLTVAFRWSEPVTAATLPGAASNEPSARPVRLVANLAMIVIIAVSATALTGFLWSRTPAIPMAANGLAAPPGWIAVDNLDQEWAPEPTSIRARTIETFLSGPREVSVCFASYSGDRRGVELINSSNAVGRSGAWTLLGSSAQAATIAGRPLMVAEYTIARGSRHRLVWTWYSIGDQFTSDPYQLRAIEARNRLFGHPQNTVLYAVSAPFQSDPSEASSILADFLK
jgi:exosortase A